MSNSPYLGEIQLFGFNFPPRNWAMCNGQLLAINQNQALFALLGTTYGGNGQTNFALPNLQGRLPMGVLSGTHALGESAGTETVTLQTTQMPAHNHSVPASGLTAVWRCKNGSADKRSPAAAVPGIDATNVVAAYSGQALNATMSGNAVALGGSLTAASVGGGQPHENRQPSLVMNYCIALTGIFPSQS